MVYIRIYITFIITLLFVCSLKLQGQSINSVFSKSYDKWLSTSAVVPYKNTAHLSGVKHQKFLDNLNAPSAGLKFYGANIKGKLFTYIYKKVEDLKPNSIYDIRINSSWVNIGSSQKNLIHVKSGYSYLEPSSDNLNKEHFNNTKAFFKGLYTIGLIKKSGVKYFNVHNVTHPFSATTDENGCFYIVLGLEKTMITEDALTDIFLKSLRVTFDFKKMVRNKHIGKTFYLNYEENYIEQIDVYSTSGHLIYSINLSPAASKYSLDLSNLVKGEYSIVSLLENGEKIVEELIIN